MLAQLCVLLLGSTMMAFFATALCLLCVWTVHRGNDRGCCADAIKGWSGWVQRIKRYDCVALAMASKDGGGASFSTAATHPAARCVLLSVWQLQSADLLTLFKPDHTRIVGGWSRGRVMPASECSRPPPRTLCSQFMAYLQTQDLYT